MTAAVILDQTGGPDVLRLVDLELPPLGASDVLVRNVAVGVNFIDIYLRRGLYPLPRLPAVLGVEGAGVVEAVGSAVAGLKAGDRVAYAGPPVGSYMAKRVLPAARLIKVPDAVDPETAAGAMLRGLTAHMLLKQVRATTPGDWLLVHAGAGGLGQILTGWARDLGARVIATVGSDEKVALARDAGADEVLLHTDPDLAGKVRELSQGGVHAAYDGLGGSMLQTTFDCVRPFGLAVSLGQAAGPIPPLSVEDLGPRRSIALARPSVMAYAADTERYRLAAGEVIARLEGGRPLRTAARYPLADASRAHADLEGGRTTGSVLLLP